jgi:four helix bundle protein
MQDYRQLRVWTDAHELALEMHKVAKRLPKSEQFALAQQIWRAAFSVPANIVEGAARNAQKDFRNFLHISLASAKELGCFLLLAKDLGHLPAAECTRLENRRDKVCAMLANLINKIVVENGKRPTFNGER